MEQHNKGVGKIITTALLQLVNFIIQPIFSILSGVLQVTQISVAMDKIEPFLDMIFTNGVQLIWLVLDLEYVRTLILIIIGIQAAMFGYKVTMWVIKKIPIINIK